MKKRIFILCIVTAMIAVSLFAVSCSANTQTYDVKDYTLMQDGKSALDIMKEICTRYPDRTAGSKDVEFLGYIDAQMQSYGYPAATLPGGSGSSGGQGGTPLAVRASKNSVTVQEFQFADAYDNNEVKKGYNLVYDIPASVTTDDRVILLAGYDNAAGIAVTKVDMTTGQQTADVIGGEGAYANASGVAVLLRTAYELSSQSLPVNVTIAFVDCSEQAWKGSEKLIEGHKDKWTGNTICLNFNRLGAGDHTYIYTDEIAQPYGDYFYSVVAKTDTDGVFSRVPANKNIAEAKIYSGQKTNYSHYAMYGDNIVFASAGIPVASYISFNWESKEQAFYTEAAGYANVFGTSQDTFGVLVERAGGGETGEQVIAKRLDAVVANAVTAVSADNAGTLMSAVAASDMNKSGDFSKTGEIVALVVKLAVIAACVIAAAVFTIKMRQTLLQKQKEKLEQVQKEMMQGMPGQEDIFGFGDSSDKKDNDKDDKNNSGNNSGGDVFEGF